MAPNFRGAQFSRVSRTRFQPRKLRSAKFVFRSLGSCAFVWSNRSGTVSLLQYFSTVTADQKLPDPQGELARDAPSSAFSTANTEVKRMQIEQQPTTKLSFAGLFPPRPAPSKPSVKDTSLSRLIGTLIQVFVIIIQYVLIANISI